MTLDDKNIREWIKADVLISIEEGQGIGTSEFTTHLRQKPNGDADMNADSR
jgi:hypothetical protein